jgi:glycosyltransferase involved in cell wall biosynthesis
MKLLILIPAYNEETTIAKVIKAIPKKIAGVSEKKIFLIDDGSIDQTGAIAQKAGAKVLTHLINQGVGTATITGFEAAKIYGADVVVTLDGDGQHDPKEISKIVNLILKKKYDVVIGSRLLDRSKMPVYKSFGNFLMNWMTYALYGLWVRDSQSGFKGFSKKAVQKLNLTSHGYEICSEIIGEIHRLKLKFTEMPIKTIYTTYSKKRGQYPLNAVNIVLKLIIKSIVK